jgi:hypothetical protein
MASLSPNAWGKSTIIGVVPDKETCAKELAKLPSFGAICPKFQQLAAWASRLSHPFIHLAGK